MTAEIKKIATILESTFSVESYVSLIREIFSTAQIVAPNKKVQEFSNFSFHVTGYFHVANYITPDEKKIIILAVEFKSNSSVENARSTQRSYAKKLIENSNSDAAVIAFYTSGESKWRLSFVRLDYEMKIEKGRLRAVETMTPARRCSFLVGQDEPSHTAIERLDIFLTDKNAQPTLEDLDDVFSVEKVTDEFFKLYCEKYHDLREHLLENEDFLAESEKCGFTVEQFAKKLMGQIVFLYFLQKKGWLGVSVWPAVLTEKEYKNVFYTPGAQGRIIKEYLPQVYLKKGEGYSLRSSALNAMPDDVEELIANNLPRDHSKSWGEGSKKFLRTLFEHAKRRGGNFYNDYLEPLFYGTLNRNRGELGYSPLLHCRIPFLSGGLFEPIKGYDWKNSHIIIPDELFSNPGSNTGTEPDGILDIFDRYNFTMSEDEPMEREVAIDPEMLGKVFENLLDVTDRKSKGAFYTPREIVHYMCQESLIHYLIHSTGLPEEGIRDFILYGDMMKDEDTVAEKRMGNGDMYISEKIFKLDEQGKIVTNRLKEIDDALADIRIADPAVGSGAFPVGMLSEIVRARQNLTEYMAVAERERATSKAQASFLIRELHRDRSAYDLKRYAIKNSIFAVDIEPSAVDIAQLRLWLSLVIDDDIDPDASSPLEGHRNPLPLPNLECNILCGNSLVDEFEGVPLLNQSEWIGTSHVGDQFNFSQSAFDAALPKLLETQDTLFSCDDPEKKKQLMSELQALKEMAIEPQLYSLPRETRDRYENSKEFASKPYILWQLEFARVFRDKGGFDIVIGNPPYIQLQKMVNDETGEKLGDQYKNLGFETFAKTGDIYCLFYEKGYRLLHENGILSFITSNKWMRAGYGEKLRGFLASNTNPIDLIDFAGQKVFESATVDVNILIFQKQPNAHNTTSCIAKDASLNNLSVFIMQNGTSMSFNGCEGWTILSPIEQRIKEKIEQRGVKLKDWDISINRGILTGYNDAFIINGAKKDELIAADPRSAELIRPILRGRDIKRYGYTFADLWLIATFPSRHYNIDDYPAVKAHLLSFGMERLEQTGKKHIVNGTEVKSRKKTSNKWFETQDSINYWDDFSKQKIMYNDINQRLSFCLVPENWYCSNTVYFISNSPEYKYLIAFLNSNLIDWYYKTLSVQLGEKAVRMFSIYVENIPIPITISKRTELESMVDIILTSKFEEEINLASSKIDSLICDAYGLTHKEKDYVESIK